MSALTVREAWKRVPGIFYSRRKGLSNKEKIAQLLRREIPMSAICTMRSILPADTAQKVQEPPDLSVEIGN